MEQILSTLLEELADQLPKTGEFVQRDTVFPDTPGLINVAIGMRRSGKTYLMYQKIRALLEQGIPLERILYINFEDDRLLPLDQRGLGQLLDTFYTLYPENHDRECYFFLDEIQNVEGWATTIRRFHDKKPLRMYLSGSSAKLLSKEIASSLRGRSIATEVWPYSFAEFLRSQDIPTPEKPFGKKKMDLFYQYFRNYSSIGGFPAVQLLTEAERRSVLKNYIDIVVLRDIVERHNVSNIALIRYLIKTLIKNVASPFSVNKFYKDIKSQGMSVGKDTIYQYLDHIEDAFLLFQLPLFTESVRKMQVNPKKIYAVDNGIVCANRLGISLTLGNLFENQIYLDLRRQGKNVHYYLTKDGYEIDFVTEGVDGQMELIQVVWDISDPDTLKRETRALEAAKAELGIKGRLLTANDYINDFFQA